MKFEKGKLTSEQKEMITSTIAGTFSQCVNLEVKPEFLTREGREVFSVEVPTYFIVNAKMVIYTVLSLLNLDPHLLYEID